MEQTTLQQRIEERAKQRLLKDLYDAAQKEAAIEYMFNVFSSNLPNKDRLWDKKLDVTEKYSSYSSKVDIRIGNEYSQLVFDTLLPKYISVVTDEILRKIDEISDMVDSKQLQNEDY